MYTEKQANEILRAWLKDDDDDDDDDDYEPSDELVQAVLDEARNSRASALLAKEIADGEEVLVLDPRPQQSALLSSPWAGLVHF